HFAQPVLPPLSARGTIHIPKIDRWESGRATTRRDFLKASATIASLTVGLASVRGDDAAAASDEMALGAGMKTPASERRGDMLYRKLGRTGETVSAIGLGGHHVGRPSDESAAIHLIRQAIDRGITFMDNSWDYHHGVSEVRM